MFEVQVKADILVGGVGACVGVAMSHRRNGQAKVMHERVTGTRSANHWDNCHRRFKNFFGGIHYDFDKWIIRVGARGGFSTEQGDLHVAESFTVKMEAEFRNNVFRLLFGDEFEIHFGGCKRRLDGLRAGTLIAAGESADGAGGREHFFDF